ncbi:hypothetical protein V5O48_006096 [Marasmius crinis-equi]|uniref:Uncharacterized protein n=1 Tax=Marasmius crinis-equi TaxID=585013 RepID=A0ABR3FKE5_9AGAR
MSSSPNKVVKLSLLHFNDVYHMTGLKNDKVIDPETGKTNDNIGHLVRFANKIEEIRSNWGDDKTNEAQGLLLFSGDLFSPSVHLMNELAPDACVPGNHEFDYGRERFDQLVEFCNFPWILSNVKEKNDNILKGLREYCVVKRCGLTIGLIGLMSQCAFLSLPVPLMVNDYFVIRNTLETVNSEVKNDFSVTGMTDASKKLAAELREQQGCDLIFALTHALHEEDEALGTATGACLESISGIDIIFGGHNHNYHLGDGVDHKNASDDPPSDPTERSPPGNRLLIVKSGTDFEDLSEVTVTVHVDEDGEAKKVAKVAKVEVIRHHLKNDTVDIDSVDKGGSRMKKVLRRQLHNEVLKELSRVIAKMDSKGLDLTGENAKATRKGETAIGNYIADAMLHWYNHLEDRTSEVTPVLVMTGGSIRGGVRLEPDSDVRARDVIQLLPFDALLILLEMEGSVLRKALNAALSLVSGLRVKWDSGPKANANERVQGIWLTKEGEGDEELDDKMTYQVLTSTYLAEGGDGFEAFKKATRKGKYEQMPMYQVLPFYIRDLGSATKELAVKIRSAAPSEGVEKQVNLLVSDIPGPNFRDTFEKALRRGGLKGTSTLPVLHINAAMNESKRRVEEVRS